MGFCFETASRIIPNPDVHLFAVSRKMDRHAALAMTLLVLALVHSFCSSHARAIGRLLLSGHGWERCRVFAGMTVFEGLLRGNDGSGEEKAWMPACAGMTGFWGRGLG
jgi:hypothetical protein